MRTTGVDWDRVPLGQAPDTTLATMLNVSKCAVRYNRLARGIDVFPSIPAKRVDWARVHDLFGFLTDRDLASLVDASRQSVSAERALRGVAPVFPAGARPTEAQKAAYPGRCPRCGALLDESTFRAHVAIEWGLR